MAIVSLKILSAHSRLNNKVPVRCLRNISPLCFGEPPLKLYSDLIVGSLNYAYFLQCLKAATISSLREDTEDELLVQPIFYFRVDTHSVETNYAPELPERRRPAVYND